ncbi:hypothetical protein HB662_01515 [Roseomonas frigidaquae]|uniref:Uncharacterized protein n=1 Tax=Falsiroseomonas frigidaquae TaxID=487318 RepID=A0ABX1ETP0_9PROT|nr:hypothetical protein [Falsiroseomonas frigidaquae]NKE43437.1 hypothetical protein [Falsiroseomonas frigidaquae]
MAADHSTPAASRRTFLATGIIVGLTPTVAISTADPDAELLAMARRWNAEFAALEAVVDQCAAAEAAGDAAGEAEANARCAVLVHDISATEDRIAELPAWGAAGLAVKAGLLARVHLGRNGSEHRHDRLARTLAADAGRLVPCAAGLKA